MIRLLKRWFGRRNASAPKSGRHAPKLGSSQNAGDRKEPGPLEKLDNPDLSLDAPQETGFDPYNTGTFNRSGSWERINRRRNS